MATTKPMQGILITDAVQAVLKHWHETEAVKPQTLIKFTSLLERYAKFATNLEAPFLAAQTEEIAAQWIRSKGRDKSGIVEPAASTMNTRRSALRKFFRDAETLNLSDSGLVVRAYVAPRPTGLARPLTEEEAGRVWMYAKDAGPHTRRPVMFALLLSGVHSSEVGLITVNDVDISNQRVWAHGDTSRLKPRWVNLEEPYFTAITERIDFVRDWLPPHYGFGTFQLTQGHFKRPRGGSQNRAASACTEVFRMAGLHKIPEITPSSVSLYAGARMLRDGERIEFIAKMLGYASLDSCVQALGFDWEKGESA
jgi:integrase/recombinase XerC